MISKVLLTHLKPSLAGAPPARTGEGFRVFQEIRFPLRLPVFTY